MHRATYCAIAKRWTRFEEKKKCTGRPTAPIITRYRCFLPDLAGLAGLRRVGPGTLDFNTVRSGARPECSSRFGVALSSARGENGSRFGA